MLRFFEISLLINGVLSYFVGVYVLYKGYKSKQIRLWAAVCFSIGTWAVGISRIVVADSYESAWFWNWFLYAGAVFIPTLYYHFTVSLLDLKQKKIKVAVFVGYAFSIFFFIANFTPYFVKDVPPVFIFKHWVEPGFLYLPYFIYFLIYLFLSLLLVFLGFKRSTGRIKQQLSYVLISGIFGLCGGITIFFPQFIGLFPFGGYFIVLYLVIMSYAIIKHRLMGIFVFVSKIYIIIILTIYLYTLYQLFVLIYNSFIDKNFTFTQFVIIQLIFSLIASLSIIPIINYVQKSSEYLFLKGYNKSEIIKVLSSKLSGIVDIKQVISIIDKELKKSVGADEVKIVYTLANEKNFANKKNIELFVAKNSGSSKEKISKNNKIVTHVLEHKDVIVQSEIEQLNKRKLLDQLKKYNAQIVAPMVTRKRIIGVIMLSQKVTQDAYTKEDIDFIEIISSQAAIAIDNARLYKEIKDFNTKLKQAVTRATKNLQSTNDELKSVNEKLVVAYEKLHKLDRAKSEFLSIASHQLRTPLTSIKGFTSLILEGTYGKVSKEVRNVLEKVFLSNERLIRLVEDLLNISRIESGKFVFELKKQDINELVDEVIESFAVPAKTKNISIELKRTGRKAPNFYFDKNKIREVLSNFIDNGLKYSEKGPIVVEIKNQKDVIRVVVSDKGLGVPEDELEYIFDKFQRGKGVNQVHTEGVGLGLYVCKKIIEAHRGKIWAESNGLGKGSRFIFELQKKIKPKDLSK